MLISLAAQKDWIINHIDMKSAFLNGYLEEEVYVEQPQGFEVEGKENGLQVEECFVWPQASTKSVVCKD